MNLRFTVVVTTSPGSTIPCNKEASPQSLLVSAIITCWLPMTWNISYSYRQHSGINSSTREERKPIHTPGNDHSPESLRLIQTNCRIGLSDAWCITLHPTSSLFHLTTNQPTKPYSQSHLTTAYDNTLISTLVNGQYQVNTGTDKLHSSWVNGFK